MFTSTLLRLCSCVPLTGDTLWETVFVTNTAAILSILNIYPAVEESISSTSCRHFLGMRLFGKGCVYTYYLIRSSQEAPKSATGYHSFTALFPKVPAAPQTAQQVQSGEGRRVV